MIDELPDLVKKGNIDVLESACSKWEMRLDKFVEWYVLTMGKQIPYLTGKQCVFSGNVGFREHGGSRQIIRKPRFGGLFKESSEWIACLSASAAWRSWPWCSQRPIRAPPRNPTFWRKAREVMITLCNGKDFQKPFMANLFCLTKWTLIYRLANDSKVYVKNANSGTVFEIETSDAKTAWYVEGAAKEFTGQKLPNPASMQSRWSLQKLKKNAFCFFNLEYLNTNLEIALSSARRKDGQGDSRYERIHCGSHSKAKPQQPGGASCTSR